jgi:hypothetical protein
LSSELRKQLEDACVSGRRVSESACRAALGSLGVVDQKVPAHLGEDDRALRRGLRAKSRQLGEAAGTVELLAAECAFEQWHRLLFARLLAENGLLIHPEYRAAVTLAECEELAEDLGEPDGWSVAGRFAAEILPGIFRVDDPCVQLRLAPEGRQELERIVAGLPVEVFTADDALGWVYQYWQKEKKDEVNASERKIGGADLGPVTQLFTENYMVRFLLENSLGAWWAARHPDSPLVKDWEYLRLDDDGAPAAGSFEGWPERVADVTVMDPCCGSGHFLVEAFGMLWQMRAEAEGLSPTAAQDAVLRDNLFGLELDPRCVQIAMFAVALAAWKAGGGWRELPVPHIACSGVPVKAPVEDWKILASGDPRLENALVRLHILFRDADTLGSLIDPKRVVELTDPTGLQVSFEDVDWDDIAPLLEKGLGMEDSDPATAVLGADAAGIARAASYLSREYTLVVTNVPYLTRTRQGKVLAGFSAQFHSAARADLACTFLDRCSQLLGSRGTFAVVSPQNWLFLGRYADFRVRVLTDMTLHLALRLGPGAFGAVSGEVVKAFLAVITTSPNHDGDILSMSLDEDMSLIAIRDAVLGGGLSKLPQASQLRNPDARITLMEPTAGEPLARVANAWQGIAPSDTPRFVRCFWEVESVKDGWHLQQSRPAAAGSLYAGRELILFWEDGHGQITDVCQEGATFRGQAAWGKRGVAVAQIGDLPGTLYTGEKFDGNAHVIVPDDQSLVPAIWQWVTSGEFAREVRMIDQKLSVTNATMSKVPFDVERWRSIAAEVGPLPEPWSDDPTQWLFEGRPEVATEPLQVAVGRLLGYRWPEQPESEDLDELADDDGIVCLPSVLGERTAADRLQELLSRAFGVTWSPARTQELLSASGSKKKDLDSWLRDDFFKAHCQLFKNRPFVWQVWDGRKDGFSALVNYHRLNRATLERLTYTYLGDWIERQTAGVREDVAGAEERLAAALDLQQRLELILEGEPPYDIYVRWKPLADQPMGWDPDLNDGVRLNVRPFVEAGVLRAKFNVKWDKDRGKNPDGSERLNNLHFTLADKLAARRGTPS